MTVRRRLSISGRVQGVGFRYTTRNLAAGFDIVGFVRNRDDGSVELQVEGAVEEMDRFVIELSDRMSGYIREVKSNTTDATGEFSGFEIRY